MSSSIRPALIGLAATLSLLAAGCSSDDDDGASVRDLDAAVDSESSASGGASVSGSASASGVASNPADGDEAMVATGGDGGYVYASNVDSHRLVVADICGIGELLDAGDFAAVEAIYRDGINSVKSDGSVRTIAGFAERDDRNHGLDTYYGTPAPLDEFISAALAGNGIFEGQPDAVRAQGVEKGIQNQVMVAWTVHELNSAIDKADEGDFNEAEGAVHNWDEGWAFFHGSEPGCSPFATGNSRAANFGTLGADGETGLANENILAAMTAGKDSLLVEDEAGAQQAYEQVMKNIVITYSQAVVRYASLIEGDLAEDNTASAKEHQAEGLAFWRVIESYVAPAGADVDVVNSIFDLANQPGANGFGEEVQTAMEPAWEALAITAVDIGELQ